MASTRKIEVAVVGDVSGLQKAFGNATASASKFKVSWGSAFKIGSATALAQKGFDLVTSAIGSTISVAADFEQQLASLRAVANPTAQQFSALREAALKFGAQTTFSARQVADAETELAKAGISTSDILGGALKGALSLAAAGNMNLADASSVAANAMNLFGLKGTDVTHIADAFATAANTTTADVGDFGMALTMGGAAAKAAGLSFDQTTVVLEALAKAGIKNSDAGTSMKNALIQVLSPTTAAAKAMAAHNLVLTDSRGKFVDAATASERLRTATEGMTAAQKVAFLSTIAGTDGFRTLLALIDAGPATLRKYTDELGKQGTAAETAAKMQDNFRGKLENLKGALETLEIRIGSALIPVLSALAVKLANIVQWVSDHWPTIQAVVSPVINAVVGGLRGLIGVLGSVAGFLNDNRAAAVGLATALGGLGAGIASIKAYGAASTALSTVLSKSLGVGVKDLISVLGGMTKSMGDAKAGASLLGSSLVNSIGKTNLYVAGVALLAGGIAALAFHMLDSKSAMDRFRDSMNQAAAASTNLATKLGILKGSALDVREAVVDLHDRQRDLATVQEQVRTGVLKGAEADSALEHAHIAVARAEQDLTTARQANKKATDDAVTATKQNITATQDEIEKAKARVAEIKNSISPLDHSTASAQKLADANRQLADLLDKASTKQRDNSDAIRKAASSAGSAAPIMQRLADKQDTVAASTDTMVGKLTTFANTAVPKAKAQASLVGSSMVQGIVSGINNNASQVSSAFQSIVASSIAAAKAKAQIRSPSKVTADELGAPMAWGIAKGIADNSGAVANAMKATIQTAIATNKLTPTQIAAQLGLITPDKTTVQSDSPGNIAYAYAQLTPGLTDDFQALTQITQEWQKALDAAAKSGGADAYMQAAQGLKSAQDALAALGPLQNIRGTLTPVAQSTQDLAQPAYLSTSTFAGYTGGFTTYSDPARQAKADAAAQAVQDMGGDQSQIMQAYQMAAANPSLMGFQLPGFGWVDLTVPLVGGSDGTDIPQLASGGIVTKPTLAMIGEGGKKEAVIPLDKLAGMGGVTLNVYPPGGMGDPHALAAAISWQLRTLAV